MYQQQEFFETEIDQGVLRMVKDMKCNGWDTDGIESLFSHRLKTTGKSECIPWFKKQMEMVRKV